MFIKYFGKYDENIFEIRNIWKLTTKNILALGKKILIFINHLDKIFYL